MRSFIGGLNRALVNAGFDAHLLLTAIRGLPRYLADSYRFYRLHQGATNDFTQLLPHPCLGDRGQSGGAACGHYFYQDLLVAQRIFLSAPQRHVDVGSRLDGFVAHVASYRTIEVCDIRPGAERIPNVRFRQVDLMASLPADLVGCCDSLSCLHALEHFGLGRYGDDVRYDGHLVGLANLHRMLVPGGTCYLSVPLGPQRIEFNAHRVFSTFYLLAMVDRGFTVARFSFVDDAGRLNEAVPLAPMAIMDNFGCHYGCGILELRRQPAVTASSRLPAPLSPK